MKFLCRTSVPRQKSENAKDSHVDTGQAVCPSRFPSAFVCVVGQKVVGVRPSSFPKHRHGLLFRSAAPLSSRKSLAGGRDQVIAGGCCDNVKPRINVKPTPNLVKTKTHTTKLNHFVTYHKKIPTLTASCTGVPSLPFPGHSRLLCSMILFLSVDSLVNLECRLRRLDMILTVFQLFCKL